MAGNRDPQVDAIISGIKRQDGLRGIVSPAEVRRLCAHIRELLLNRQNVKLESDWLRLGELSRLCRCFTIAEADRIERLYSTYKYPRNRQKNKLGVR